MIRTALLGMATLMFATPDALVANGSDTSTLTHRLHVAPMPMKPRLIGSGKPL